MTSKVGIETHGLVNNDVPSKRNGLDISNIIAIGRTIIEI
jgi:hypothetical protein